ncbi:hypothetical protein CES86_5510 [Brucella lupini]|uniref:Uncharacterized protein n=1 Tax=Brucella lupini TaxID=255457 RepID=A0A256H1I2_9HYPH|nr:hypothetical protein CES86_5510 [Brucella lupini]
MHVLRAGDAWEDGRSGTYWNCEGAPARMCARRTRSEKARVARGCW